MTPTTHISASCLISVLTIQTELDGISKLFVASGGSLLAHLILDLVPHGLITTPYTIFKRKTLTILELLPGPLIMLLAIWRFENPLLFLVASFFGLIPDLCSVLFCKGNVWAQKIPFISPVHKIHRKIHWFETENADGSVSSYISNTALLTLEAFVLLAILVCLFI